MMKFYWIFFKRIRLFLSLKLSFLCISSFVLIHKIFSVLCKFFSICSHVFGNCFQTQYIFHIIIDIFKKKIKYIANQKTIRRIIGFSCNIIPWAKIIGYGFICIGIKIVNSGFYWDAVYICKNEHWSVSFGEIAFIVDFRIIFYRFFGVNKKSNMLCNWPCFPSI